VRTIAHLSDLHFGAADPSLVTALTETIVALAPDVIAVSGDLTQRARRTQFLEARQFLDTLDAPKVVVPGNHDVPLYNVAARFATPLSRFRRYITADSHPCVIDDEVLVVGANSTRSLTIKEGSLRAGDVRHLSRVLATAPATTVRIVVCHHPFDDAHGVETLIGHGADIFLTGHLHLSAAGHTALRYRTRTRSAIAVEAGTATSVRGRGEPNAFNVLRVERDTVTVERMAWRAGERCFAGAQRDEFRRGESGWMTA
jgi:3',5'-cyclic AMP phosphodiesterase CpdA